MVDICALVIHPYFFYQKVFNDRIIVKEKKHSSGAKTCPATMLKILPGSGAKILLFSVYENRFLPLFRHEQYCSAH